MLKKKKVSRVEFLTEAANTAVGVVRSMLKSLETVNEEIMTEQVMNAEKIAQIQADNEALDKLKADNEKIISNFGALLS